MGSDPGSLRRTAARLQALTADGTVPGGGGVTTEAVCVRDYSAGARREAVLRWTARAVEPPMTIIATFAPSTASAESELENLPSPIATPKNAAAGIVVTEMAPPIAEPARVSTASIPPTPAASAT